MKQISSLFLVIISSIISVTFLAAGPCYSQPDSSEEVEMFIQQLNAPSIKARTDAAKRIERSGLTDPKIFDIINARLMNIDDKQKGDKYYIDMMAWYCKALASSGRAEYGKTLKELSRTSKSRKLKKYAKQSYKKLDEYAKRNALIRDTTNAPEGLSAGNLRHYNMITSGDPALVITASKEIFRAPSVDPIIYDTMSDTLLDQYDKSKKKNHMTAMSWLVKALGASKNEKYIPTLETVIENTRSPQLSKKARKSLAALK